jgi:hypothetical protein
VLARQGHSNTETYPHFEPRIVSPQRLGCGLSKRCVIFDSFVIRSANVFAGPNTVLDHCMLWLVDSIFVLLRKNICHTWRKLCPSGATLRTEFLVPLELSERPPLTVGIRTAHISEPIIAHELLCYTSVFA